MPVIDELGRSAEHAKKYHGLRYHCETRVCPMTMSNKCATHVLDRGKSESCLVKAPAKHTSGSVLVVSELLNTSVQANTERDTKPRNTRENVLMLGNKQHSAPRDVCPASGAKPR